MDRKRILGPELSVLPLFDRPETTPDLLDDNGKRYDGRNPEDIRPIFLKTGLINQANGSAYIELDKTKLACAVYGPRQTKKQTFSNKGLLNCELKFATFSCAKRRGHQRDAQEKEYSQILSESLAPAVRLDLLPKSTVDVFVTVLENGGTSSCIAAAVTAASVALADAGIEMLDQVAASSAVFTQDQILMDPSAEEENHQKGLLVVSYMPSINEVTHVLQTGETEGSVTVQAVEQCIDACSKIYGVMSAALIESLEVKN
ncbi:ribosomal protein S5 domain 2-type protein [Endogone sp. FLAS-F59071]|nr:ribosomal protein S5 domain 2-type protein [Endogone sp. FLAS-F59071]RUS18355.1 ribosomal protein S5 domain 2-type protein [Endogone sp. FLAS-F59071]|eukprot:RUS17431.1 ribosomal protein S5 domain 2-type protein [Endogone sp. FLAS-F59071]